MTKELQSPTEQYDASEILGGLYGPGIIGLKGVYTGIKTKSWHSDDFHVSIAIIRDRLKSGLSRHHRFTNFSTQLLFSDFFRNPRAGRIKVYFA